MGTYKGNELKRNLSGNTQPQSSEFAEPLWTDPGLNSGINVRELISTSKKKKKERKRSAVGELMVQPSPKIMTSEEKATTTRQFQGCLCKAKVRHKKFFCLFVFPTKMKGIRS